MSFKKLKSLFVKTKPDAPGMYVHKGYVHIGPINNIRINQSNVYNASGVNRIQTDPTKASQIPDIVKENFNNIEMLNKSHFDVLKTNISDETKLVKSLCPYLDEELSTCDDKEKMSKILEEWCEANGRYATIGILCAQLWEIGEKRAAESLALSCVGVK